MEWTKEATKVLIQLYEENELLYNSLNANYRNRTKRLECLMKIAEHLTSVTGQMCLVMDVRKKINGLRSQYTQEKLKMAKSACQGGVIYEPTAYWFPLLKFLDLPNEYDETLSYPDESDGIEKSQTSEETDKKLRKITKRKKSVEKRDKPQDVAESVASWTNGNDGNYQLLELNPFIEKRRKIVLNGTYVPEQEDEHQKEATQETQTRNEEMRRNTQFSSARMNSFAETVYSVNDNDKIQREEQALKEATQNLQRAMEQFKGKRACSNTAINSFTDLLAIELQEILDTDKKVYTKIKIEMLRILCDAWNKLTNPQNNNTEVQTNTNPVRDRQTNVVVNLRSTSKGNSKKKTSNGSSVPRKVPNAESKDVPEANFERFLISHNLCSCAKCAKHRHNAQETQGTNGRPEGNPSATHKDNNLATNKN